MRVLMVYRYFWPDAPHLGDMEKDIADELVRSGHQVTVFTGSSSHVGMRRDKSYPTRTRVGDLDVWRARQPQERRSNIVSRVGNEILFQTQLLWCIARNRRKLDKIVVSSMPPWAGPSVARFSRRVFGIPFVFHMWDIHPEVDLYAGRIKEGALYRFLRAFDRRNCNKAETVVTLSHDMIEELRRRDVTARIVRIPNFVAGLDGDPETPASTEGRPFEIIYAGNMGRYQGVETVLEVARRMQDEPAVFRLVGSGSRKEDIARQVADDDLTNVIIEDHVPLEEAAAKIAAADLAYLPLHPLVTRTAHPSKLPIYLLTGTRLLAAVDSGSELAALINQYGIGSVAQPLDAESLVASIRQEMGNRQDTSEFSRKLLNDEFNRNDALRSWVDVVTEPAS